MQASLPHCLTLSSVTQAFISSRSITNCCRLFTKLLISCCTAFSSMLPSKPVEATAAAAAAAAAAAPTPPPEPPPSDPTERWCGTDLPAADPAPAPAPSPDPDPAAEDPAAAEVCCCPGRTPPTDGGRDCLEAMAAATPEVGSAPWRLVPTECERRLLLHWT
jgi:hypothetical protein